MSVTSRHLLRYVVKTPTVSFDETCMVPTEFVSNRNYIVYCYECGLVWARIYAIKPGEWLSRQDRCPECGDTKVQRVLSVFAAHQGAPRVTGAESSAGCGRCGDPNGPCNL